MTMGSESKKDTIVANFKSFIEMKAGESDRDDTEDVFVDWYSKLRKGFSVRHKSAKKDGNIDLILDGGDRLIIAQIRYKDEDIAGIRAFAHTISCWKDRVSFNKWVENEVSDAHCKPTYKAVFEELSAGSKKAVWEFVCLKNFKADKSSEEKPKNTGSSIVKDRKNTEVGWREILEGSGGKESTARLITIKLLNYYAALDKLGAGSTEPLEVKAESTLAKHKASFKGNEINTTMYVVDLDDLLVQLKKQIYPQAFFARNVRLKIPGSVVNKTIRNTYENEPDQFFFDNNGINIVCTRAPYEGDTLTMEQPSIINGGQTIRTLLEDLTLSDDVRSKRAMSQSSAKILARVTVIKEEVQADPDIQKFINNMIFRSNSNNKMEPRDLRSNESVQVEVAQNLVDLGIFYERKKGEWKDTKSNMRLHIDSLKLAQNIVICNDDALGTGQGGPVKLKKIGETPLFMTVEEDPQKGCYDEVFSKNNLNYKLLERQTKLYLALDKASSAYKKTRLDGVPEAYKGFKKASSNFVFGLIWRAIQTDDGKSIDLCTYNLRKMPELGKLVKAMKERMYAIFENAMVSKKVTQNNIFRIDGYWTEAKNEFLFGADGKDWVKRIIKAINDDLHASTDVAATS